MGGETYRKKITPPDSTELLTLTVEELDELMTIKTIKGPSVWSKDSHFIAYSLDAKDLQTIRQAYLKIRLIHIKARHIICAYLLPGADAQKHVNGDYCDDQETGAGAQILEIMEKNNVSLQSLLCG